MPEAKILDDYHRGWISGLLDGEGSISTVWHKRKKSRLISGGREPFRPSIRITITNTSLALLEAVKEVTGLGTIHQKRSKRSLRKKPGYTYQISNHSEAEELLSGLSLIVKERHRELALQLLEIKKKFSRNGQGTPELVRSEAKRIARELDLLNDGEKGGTN